MRGRNDFYEKLFASGVHLQWNDAPGKKVIIDYIIHQHIDVKSELLDIGCGGGYLVDTLIKLIDKKIIGYGIDVSENAIAEARSMYPGNFEVGDAMKLPFENSRFSVVVSYGVFEHVEKPEIAVKELSRVLESGGIFACMMPTIPFYREDRVDEGWYEDLNNPPQLQWNYRRSRWEQYFSETGLKLIDMCQAKDFGALKPGNFYFGAKI